jgi:ribonucleoside-triphosphate reductase (thioredoxin)
MLLKIGKQGVKMVKLNYSSIRKEYGDKLPPWGPVGYVTYKRTYSRLKNDGTSEEWWETVLRCVNGIQDLGANFNEYDLKMLYHYVFNFKCSFSGRALWQLGTDTVHKIGSDSLQNCWAVSCNEIDAFLFAFNELMLGGGVGFNIQANQVYSLPTVKHVNDISRVDSTDVGFIVPDNREGWVELLRKVLTSYFYTGESFTYSTMSIRSKGAKIKTFGGVASGPEILVTGIRNICKVLDSRAGKKVRPIDCLDIMNNIGQIVVSGNIRRSAQIALGDSNDIDFLRAKRWDLGYIPNWRSMSNNSVVCNNIEDLPDIFWDSYTGNGEPYGLINLENCRNYGRMCERVKDHSVIGVNPCGEIALAPYEPCNLAEIFLTNLNDIKEFRNAARLMYTVCSTIASWPFINEKTNHIVFQNRRIGISVTGYCDTHIFTMNHLNEIYNYIQMLNTSRDGFECLKLTTIKPSGTLSLLAGTTPGMHPALAHTYLRRIRMPSNNPIVQTCINHGYNVEPEYNYDGTTNRNTVVVSFPVRHSKGTYIANDFNAVQLLSLQNDLQRNWSDNAVSATIYYTPEEVPAIQNYLKTNWSTMKGVSFLLKQDHGFVQAPIEPITDEEYEKYVAKTQPITRVQDYCDDDNVLDCDGACPVR